MKGEYPSEGVRAKHSFAFFMLQLWIFRGNWTERTVPAAHGLFDSDCDPPAEPGELGLAPLQAKKYRDLLPPSFTTCLRALCLLAPDLSVRGSGEGDRTNELNWPLALNGMVRQEHCHSEESMVRVGLACGGFNSKSQRASGKPLALWRIKLNRKS